jgi:hypothetical protein
MVLFVILKKQILNKNDIYKHHKKQHIAIYIWQKLIKM